jgi:hypothetical protein
LSCNLVRVGQPKGLRLRSLDRLGLRFSHASEITIVRIQRTSGVFCRVHSFYVGWLFFHLDTYYGGT